MIGGLLWIFILRNIFLNLEARVAVYSYSWKLFGWFLSSRWLNSIFGEVFQSRISEFFYDFKFLAKFNLNLNKKLREPPTKIKFSQIKLKTDKAHTPVLRILLSANIKTSINTENALETSFSQWSHDHPARLAYNKN